MSDKLIRTASQTTVGALLRQQTRIRPDKVALEDIRGQWTYRQLNQRVNRLAQAWSAAGVGHGDRVAVLSENRAEYVEAEFATAKLGAIVAALNWRLTADELDYCIKLAAPRAALVSPQFVDSLAAIDHGIDHVTTLGPDYEALLQAASDAEPPEVAAPEDGLMILYTSGTTGRPKGAVISHRAFLYRVLVFCADYGITGGDCFPAWAPMFHMASTDLAIGALLIGGKVVQVDGFEVEHLCDVLSRDQVGWLLLMPGVVDRLIDRLRAKPIAPAGLKFLGAMADLVPRHQIGDITGLLGKPYLNSFGATETGIPPASAGLIPAGVVPDSLSKTQNSYCEIRLVDDDDNDVADGLPGELAIRGPTLFSGYWRAPEVNAKDFRGGWFHMGDMFKRNADGTLDFVDRAKYMIKSGGENIYPAEIERVLLEEARVADAVVVRQPDDRWGEVPVAVVARNDTTLSAAELTARCRDKLAGYKRPKNIIFVALDDLPRSTTGKIQRHEVERKWLAKS